MKTKDKKPNLYVGKPGVGKTYSARANMGTREYITCQATDIPIEDVYSFPKEMGIIIEDLHETKIQKDKILDLIYSGRYVALTSYNKKDVPKSIVNACQIRYPGKYDRRQVMIKLKAINAEEVKTFDESIWELSQHYIKAKNRDNFHKLLLHNEPAPMQIISWLSASMPSNEKLAYAASVMHRWPVKYLYALIAYSNEGTYGSVKPPKRKQSNPLPYICKKLGLRESDVYLLRSLLKKEEYKIYAAKKLSADECKVLGIKKPRRVRETKRKATVKSLEDFL